MATSGYRRLAGACWIGLAGLSAVENALADEASTRKSPAVRVTQDKAKPRKSGVVTGVLVSPSRVAAGSRVTVTIGGTGTCGELSVGFGSGRPVVLTDVALPHAIAHVFAQAGHYTISVTGSGNPKHCTGAATASIQVQAPVGKPAAPDIGHQLPGGNTLSPIPEPMGLKSAFYFLYPTYERVDALRANAQWKLPLTDGNTSGLVYFSWNIPDLTPEQAEALAQNACCATMLVNGVKAQAKWMSVKHDAIKDGNLAAQLTGFDVTGGAWPRTLKATVTSGGRTWSSMVFPIYSGPTIRVFQKNLYPAFRHPRCTNCHDMGSGEAIIARHLAGSVGVETFVQPQNNFPCSNCHKPPEASDWRSPFFSQGIQWSTMGARQICLTVKDKLPTAQQTSDHFHLDPRVRWALSSGVTPYGKHLETAPPGDMDKFLAIVDDWIAAGRPCPP
jgi:Cu/Ag efflux protein CusF